MTKISKIPSLLASDTAKGPCKHNRLYLCVGGSTSSPAYRSHTILEGPITLGILDRFGSTIASMIALAHADILQLFSGPPEVCAANERRWSI